MYVRKCCINGQQNSVTMQVNIWLGSAYTRCTLSVSMRYLLGLWSDCPQHVLIHRRWLLGSFAKLREAAINFVMSVRPSVLSVRMEQLGSYWMDFHEIWYVSIFRKSFGRIQVSLKSYKDKGHFTWRAIYIFFYHISASSSKNEKCFRPKLQWNSKSTFDFQYFFKIMPFMR
jgi:hypothetical protein